MIINNLYKFVQFISVNRIRGDFECGKIKINCWLRNSCILFSTEREREEKKETKKKESIKSEIEWNGAYVTKSNHPECIELNLEKLVSTYRHRFYSYSAGIRRSRNVCHSLWVRCGAWTQFDLMDIQQQRTALAFSVFGQSISMKW